VHASPSLQATPFCGAPTCWQAPPAVHASAVHGLPSEQSLGAAMHLEPPDFALRQVPGSRQGWPRSHFAPSGRGVTTVQEPVLGSQPSDSHAPPSGQTTASPGSHLPPRHVSTSVQGSPSLHPTPIFLGWWQPDSGSHRSFVQGVSSSHARGCPRHRPLSSHVSSCVQALASSQGAPAARVVWTHVAVLAAHSSSVHGLWSSQPEGQDGATSVAATTSLAPVSDVPSGAPSSEHDHSDAALRQIAAAKSAVTGRGLGAGSAADGWLFGCRMNTTLARRWGVAQGACAGGVHAERRSGRPSGVDVRGAVGFKPPAAPPALTSSA